MLWVQKTPQGVPGGTEPFRWLTTLRQPSSDTATLDHSDQDDDDGNDQQDMN